MKKFRLLSSLALLSGVALTMTACGGKSDNANVSTKAFKSCLLYTSDAADDVYQV